MCDIEMSSKLEEIFSVLTVKKNKCIGRKERWEGMLSCFPLPQYARCSGGGPWTCSSGNCHSDTWHSCRHVRVVGGELYSFTHMPGHSYLSANFTSLFDCRLHYEIMDIYMPVYRSSPCLKWCPSQGDFTLPDYLPCYFHKSSTHTRLPSSSLDSASWFLCCLHA